jgi:hypothetical protein
MLYKLPYYMAVCLGVTLAAETGTAFLLGYRRRDLLFIALANMLTNPPVVVLSYMSGLFWGKAAKIAALAALESAAFLTEAAVYAKTLERKKLNPFLLSLILNAVSYLFGLLIQ